MTCISQAGLLLGILRFRTQFPSAVSRFFVLSLHGFVHKQSSCVTTGERLGTNGKNDPHTPHATLSLPVAAGSSSVGGCNQDSSAKFEDEGLGCTTSISHFQRLLIFENERQSRNINFLGCTGRHFHAHN